jgi:hypothetical protein
MAVASLVDARIRLAGGVRVPSISGCVSFEAEGVSTAIELRHRFPGVTDSARALDHTR